MARLLTFMGRVTQANPTAPVLIVGDGNSEIQDRVDGLHPALPACRQSQAIARLAAWPAEPRLHPGLDLLI
jgi:hypothetical protein